MRASPLSIPILHCTGSPSECTKIRTGAWQWGWCIRMEKEGIKLYVFIGDITVYIENPKESFKNTSWSEVAIGDYSKAAGHKVNIQKSIAFL